MAGCLTSLSLSMLATHGYNNIITHVWNNTNKNDNKKRTNGMKITGSYTDKRNMTVN